MNENTERETMYVENQKGAILQTYGLYILYTENIKVETSHLLGTSCRRFFHSIEWEFGSDGTSTPHTKDFSWLLKN